MNHMNRVSVSGSHSVEFEKEVSNFLQSLRWGHVFTLLGRPDSKINEYIFFLAMGCFGTLSLVMMMGLLTELNGERIVRFAIHIFAVALFVLFAIILFSQYKIHNYAKQHFRLSGDLIQILPSVNDSSGNYIHYLACIINEDEDITRIKVNERTISVESFKGFYVEFAKSTPRHIRHPVKLFFTTKLDIKSQSQ